MNAIQELKKKKKLVKLLKVVCSIFVIYVVFRSLFVYGLKPYYSYRDYNYQNTFSEKQAVSLEGVSTVKQSFLAKGNVINELSVYIGEISDEKIRISIYKSGGETIASYDIIPDAVHSNSWNNLVGFKSENLIRGEKYVVEFSSDGTLNPLILSTGEAPSTFATCEVDGREIDGTIAMGMKSTYRYLTMGSLFELSILTLLAVIACLALCYSILRVEDLFHVFISSDKKEGFKAALYYSISLVLLYNPIEAIRTEVSNFGRIMGAGIAANVDVSKRTGNFDRWFMLFAISFTLLWLLFNKVYHDVRELESKKILSFLDNFFVIANCSLTLRCITYFNDESKIPAAYYFTTYAVMLISLIAVSYIVLKLERKVSATSYAYLHFIGLSISLPLTVFTALEWGEGRVLMGWWAITATIIILYCNFFASAKMERITAQMISIVTVMVSVIPLLTSLYIELIHVMNQYNVFVAHPAKYYKTAMLLYVIAGVGGCFIIHNKKAKLEKIKHWIMPVFVFGVSCMSIQIPLSSTYNPDLFEGANYSILISDFFGFGKIPIVEHYGGHMMTSVWEAIIYGVINHDYFGAIVSPYSQLITPFLVVLFYFFIKEIWDEQMAPLVALLFPFYGFWSYYGLGMMVCLAVILYIRSNTYPKASLIWASFIWCAIYRLDLGFAFGMALIVSLGAYVIVTRNRIAMKQLMITLGSWVVVGMTAWCVICIAKGVNPIYRLKEFLMINLSNQNWAYAGIGNAENTLFGWSYIIVPFAVVIGTLYTFFSKQMRERISVAEWMFLLIFGLSYFANFSRGLVRHSLAETATTVVIWSGYLFLALFISKYKDDNRLFLPVFMLLILCNTLFVQDSNFTSTAIAENAVNRPSAIIESWRPERFSIEEHGEHADQYMTYWEQIKHDGEKVTRVKFDNNLERYINKFRVVITILENDETFVDFMNKTLLFSMLGKENPVYVSQSPLQLSGEFTQEEFIKEISEIPLVLMPVDGDNYRASNSLDGLTNAYRYYKVSEYIYQNYIPLLQYGNDYAVWCLRDRVDEYKHKLESVMEGREYIQDLLWSETIRLGNAELSEDENGYASLRYIGPDPMVMELQTVIDVQEFIDCDIQICIKYTTDTDGQMQLFYTTEEGENYTGDKVVTENISGTGIAYFTVPLSEYSRLRLDTPEGSNVVIKSLVARAPISFIEYGYDGPIANDDSENVTYDYISALHNHNIGQLPRIWAEGDREESSENLVIAEPIYDGDIFIFDPSAIQKNAGNYLMLSAAYDGKDTDGLFYDDNEQVKTTIIMGRYINGCFEEKCRYILYLQEGVHDNLIRCSTDYYWYLNEINAVKVQSDDEIYNVSVKILEGD